MRSYSFYPQNILEVVVILLVVETVLYLLSMLLVMFPMLIIYGADFTPKTDPVVFWYSLGSMDFVLNLLLWRSVGPTNRKSISVKGD